MSQRGHPPPPHPLLHGNLVVVADGVFTQEVKLHHKLLAVLLGVQVDVLHAQRAAAHRVGCLALLLLVTGSQSELVGGTRRPVSLRNTTPTPSLAVTGRPVSQHGLIDTFFFLTIYTHILTYIFVFKSKAILNIKEFLHTPCQ